MRKEQLAELDQAFGFMRSGNALVSSSWLMLVIRNAYSPGFPRLEEYLQISRAAQAHRASVRGDDENTGRRRHGEEVFAQARPGYHAYTAAAIDAIVNPASEDAE